MTIEGVPLIMDDKTNRKYKVPYFYITFRFQKSRAWEFVKYISLYKYEYLYLNLTRTPCFRENEIWKIEYVTKIEYIRS